jgi:hypothetical protein
VIPETIVCPDCGGTAHRLTHVDPDDLEPAAIISYRCSDCLDRWDVDWSDAGDGSGDEFGDGFGDGSRDRPHT